LDAFGEAIVAEGEGGQRPGFWQLGPLWISALAAAVTALAGVGFFAGRATAPSGTAAGPAPTTHTATSASSPPAAPTAIAAAAGKLLTHYSVDISDTYYLDLTDKPARPQKDDGSDPDLYFVTGEIISGNRIQMASLDGAAPTYAACMADTRFVSLLLSVEQGDTFCLVGHGLVAGVTAKKVDVGSVATIATLDIAVWRSQQS
jgi:hypothetical protein